MNILQNMTQEELDGITCLGLDDTFELDCRQCGKCCHNSTDLYITPYDLFGIALHLGKTTEEVVEQYCELVYGHTTGFPFIRIKPVPPYNSCPFAAGGKCGVHENKPVICRAYPLARLTRGDGEIGYFFNGATCGHESNAISVRDWLGDAASPEAEQAGRLWFEAVEKLTPHIQPELYPSRRVQLKEIGMIFGNIWFGYDTSLPFLPQFHLNIEWLKGYFRDREQC